MSQLNESQIESIVKQVISQLGNTAASTCTSCAEKEEKPQNGAHFKGRKYIGVYEDMNDAIAAANEGYKCVRAMSVEKREKIITAIRELTRAEAETMAKLGVINGRTADTFDPNAFITRAEFAAICARFAEAEFEIDGKFTDVAGHWAEKEIYEAAEYGWIRGYEDSTFKPDRYITRAEAMTMINRVLNRVPETADDVHDDAKKWSDNSDETAWYYIPVQEATNGHNYTKDNHIYETHTELTEDIDWTKYE